MFVAILCKPTWSPSWQRLYRHIIQAEKQKTEYFENELRSMPYHETLMSEHGPRMKLCEVISERLCENSRKPRQESFDLSFFKKMELFSGYVFLSLPSVANRSKFATDYSLQLTIAICLYLKGKTFFLILLTFVIVHFVHMTPLNPQSINYLMLWIKLAISWHFSLPHLSAPFSQAPLPLQQ